MDKQEQREIIGEIKKAYARGDFDRVLEYAGEINLRKLGDSRTMEMIADAHAANGQLEDARDVLLMAYEKTPMGRKMAYKLSELSIALDNLDDAVEFYEDFCKMAPHDNDRYLLKYKIGKAGGVAPEDLVKVLAAYCSKEVDERWMYELASLYYKLREKEKCLEICDNIILWFANGDYVRKAESLKMRLSGDASPAVPQEKEMTASGVIGQDIPVEGYIDMSGQPAAPKEEYNMDDMGDSFLQDALAEDTPDKDMAIGDAMALAEAKEQAEFVNAAENFEVFQEKPKRRVREIVPVVRKYEQMDESISFDTKPEPAPEGNQYEVNGEVITLPKTTFEDMSHDWTIPEELLNAEDTGTPAEEFEEPVYGAHRYVPPAEQKDPEFEEPVYGAHRVVTKAEEEAAREQMAKELEEAGNNLEMEEVVREAAPAEPVIPPAEVAPVTEEEAVPAVPVVEAAAPAAEVTEAAPEIPAAEAAPEIPAVEVAPPPAPAQEPVPQETIPEIPEEEKMQATDNPIISAVIEPVREEEPDTLQSWNHFDSVFPPAFNEPEEEPERPAEDETEEKPVVRTYERTAEARAEAKEGTILFAIAPQEDEAEVTPDSLVLPETADADAIVKNMEKTAAAQALAEAQAKEQEAAPEPEVKAPEAPKPVKVPLSFSITPEPVREEASVPTEVIRPAGSSKYSSVNSLFAEEETDNIAGQITLDSMFATYSKREVREEPVIPETPASVNRAFEPEAVPEEPAAEEAVPVPEEEPAYEEPAPVPREAAPADDGEPPLITDLAGAFGEYEEAPAYAERKYTNTVSEELPYDVPVEPEPVYEEPAVEEPAAEADAELSDFEKAMLAYDAARAEGKEGFDFQSLMERSIQEGPEEDFEDESEYEEYVEQRYDEEPEEFDEEYEDGFDEFEEEYDEYEDDYDEYEEEYEEGEYDEETEGFEDDFEEGVDEEDDVEFESEFDGYEAEPEEFEEEYEEEYEDGFDGEFEDGYEEEYAEGEEAYDEEYDDEYAEEFDEEYVEELEEYEEGYEEGFDDGFEEGFEETAEEEGAYEEEPYEDEEGYEDEEADEEEYEDEYEETYDDYSGGYEMSDDLRDELSEFLLIDGMEERINTAIDSLIEKKRHGDPTGGNLIVTGDTKSGKTYLTIAVIKAVGREIGGNSRVAKVNAQALNGKNMQKVFEKIAGSDLLIENVGYLTDETVDSLIDILRKSSLSSMVALEGNQLAIDNMISNHPALKNLFQTRLNVKELNLTQWADLACRYAEEQGYTVSDMALLALHAKIDELNIPTARLGYEDIKGVIDTAIDNASRRGGGKFRFGSKKHKGNARQLEEADFM